MQAFIRVYATIRTRCNLHRSDMSSTLSMRRLKRAKLHLYCLVTVSVVTIGAFSVYTSYKFRNNYDVEIAIKERRFLNLVVTNRPSYDSGENPDYDNHRNDTVGVDALVDFGVVVTSDDQQKQNDNEDSLSVHRRHEVVSLSPTKKVTKSLSELGSTPSINSDILFFNRVPKTGSEMFVLLITWLQGINTFRHYRLPGGRRDGTRKLTRLQQEILVDDVTEFTKSAGTRTSFDRHVYFTNFSSFGKQNPIYVNVIRDPIDKLMSRFYYADLKNRKVPSLFEDCVQKDDEACRLVLGKSYDLTIPYFCGHDDWCSSLGNKWALARAKKNAEKYFKVVGVLEHLNETLSLFESRIPQYFKGVRNLYFNELLQPHHNRNKNNPRQVKASTRLQLKSKLQLEYEFYDFITTRLWNQFSSAAIN